MASPLWLLLYQELESGCRKDIPLLLFHADLLKTCTMLGVLLEFGAHDIECERIGCGSPLHSL